MDHKRIANLVRTIEQYMPDVKVINKMEENLVNSIVLIGSNIPLVSRNDKLEKFDEIERIKYAIKDLNDLKNFLTNLKEAVYLEEEE